MNDFGGFVVALLGGITIGLMLGAIIGDGAVTPVEASKMCADTGGTLLVTEYNTETGITFNCFYPTADTVMGGTQNL